MLMGTLIDTIQFSRCCKCSNKQYVVFVQKTILERVQSYDETYNEDRIQVSAITASGRSRLACLIL